MAGQPSMQTQTDSQGQHAGGGRHRPGLANLCVFLAVAGATLAGDLASKHVVFASFLSDPSLGERIEGVEQQTHQPADSKSVLDRLHLSEPFLPGINLTLSTNPGVVFGWALPRKVVLIASVVTMALVGFFFANSPRRAWAVHIGLGLVLAGAMGNLYDRLFSEVVLPGLEPIRYQVRDFIDASRLYYPYIFNLADAWLVIGVVLLVISSFGSSRAGKTGSA